MHGIAYRVVILVGLGWLAVGCRADGSDSADPTDAEVDSVTGPGDTMGDTGKNTITDDTSPIDDSALPDTGTAPHDTDTDVGTESASESDSASDTGNDTITGNDTASDTGLCGAEPLDMDATGIIADDCGMDGIWYWYADEEGTTVTGIEVGQIPFRPGYGMCLTGSTIADPSFAAWGAGVGFNPNAVDGMRGPWDASAHGVIGFEVTLSGSTKGADLRMMVESVGERQSGESPPFTVLDRPGTHRVLFESFTVPDDWTPNGGEQVDPAAIYDVNFHVAGGDIAADFDFCIEQVAPMVAEWVDDLEDGDHAIIERSGRSGNWYTYNDETGTQTPAPPSGEVNTAGAGENGGFAAYTTGSGFSSWGAGMGYNFAIDETLGIGIPYDASEYSGLSALVRGNSPTRTVRIIPMTAATTDPAYGGTCDVACGEPHFFEVPLTDTWTRVAFPFSWLFQLGTHPVPFDASTLMGTNYQVLEGASFELAVDEVALYRSAVIENAPDPGISIDLGPRADLLGAQAHGLESFPDQPVIALDLADTTRFFITAWPMAGTPYPSAGVDMPTFALDAPDITALADASPVEVLSPGGAGSFDNGYTGLAGIYRHSDGRLYGFYHAEDQEETGLIPNTGDVAVPAFYASIGAAVSDDDGLTWTKLGPVVTSNKPKDWLAYPDHTDRGVCGPSAVVDTSSRYLFLYYTDNSRQNGRGVQISLARADLTKGPPIPGAFEKYYLGAFGEPGIGGLESPLPGAGAQIYYPCLGYGHVVYSDYLRRYVMVLNVDYWQEHVADLPVEKSGIYVRFSEDGIFWSEPRSLVTDYVAFRSGYSFSYMGQILWDDDTGHAGWLVYAHSDNWGSAEGEEMHHLVGHRITFEPAAL